MTVQAAFSVSAPIFLATLEYAGSLPPFCVDIRAVHRTSDYIGAGGGSAAVALERTRRDLGDRFFEVSSGIPQEGLSQIYAAFSAFHGDTFEGVVALNHEEREIGYQQFTLSFLHQERVLEISMDYVYVDPDYRGRGFRDLMQACLLGATLLLGLRTDDSIRLKYRLVKNPNNVERYRAAGFEEVQEIAEPEEDDPPYAWCVPSTTGVILPSSYQMFFGPGALRARLRERGLISP